MRFFRLFQHLAPVAMVPLAYLLFLDRYGGSHAMTLFMLTIPVVFSYVLPAVGMNHLKLWRMKTGSWSGRIQPHHGLLFGSGSSLFVLICLDVASAPVSFLGMLRAGVVLGSVVAFWNWLYDIHAIRVGYIEVFNRPFQDGKGPEAIATDYVPVVIGVFGFVYGVAVRAAEHYLLIEGRTDLYWSLLIGFTVAATLLPALCFVAQSFLVHGVSGLRPYRRE